MRQRRARRRAPFTAQQHELQAQVARILAQHDPLGLIAPEGHNADEYAGEARAIVRQAGEAATPAELQRLIYTIFCSSFSVSSAGPEDRYAPIVRAIWPLLAGAGR